MTIFNLLFLIPLFIIGLVCSYTDIRYGKIRNKWIGLGLLWTLVLYLSLALLNYFYFHQQVNSDFLKEMIINGLTALILGYLLWRFKFLAAGDAKLFTLYAFLIPPEFYSKFYFFGFPSFVFLVNIFTPFLLFLMIKVLIFVVKKTWSGRKERKKTPFQETLKKILLQLFKLLRAYIGFVLILFVLQLILRRLNLFPASGENKYLIYFFVFSFFTYRFVSRFIFKIKILNIIVSLAGLGVVAYLNFSGQTDFLFNTVKLTIVFMFFSSILKKLANFYIERNETRKINLDDLEIGFFPSFQNLGNDLGFKLGKIDRVGLTREQVDILKEFLLHNPDKEIRVYKTFALAPFIFLGAILTILTRESFLGFLARLLGLLF